MSRMALIVHLKTAPAWNKYFAALNGCRAWKVVLVVQLRPRFFAVYTQSLTTVGIRT